MKNNQVLLYANLYVSIKTPDIRTKMISPKSCQRVAAKFTLAPCHLQSKKKVMIAHCVESHVQGPSVYVPGCGRLLNSVHLAFQAQPECHIPRSKLMCEQRKFE
jgi:hypothetical protein